MGEKESTLDKVLCGVVMTGALAVAAGAWTYWVAVILYHFG